MTINISGEGTLLEHLEALRVTVWRCVLAVCVALIPALYFSADVPFGANFVKIKKSAERVQKEQSFRPKN